METVEDPKDLLDDILSRTDSKLSEGFALRIIRDLALAINHIHEKNYYHCDIKPEVSNLNEFS